MLWKGKSDLHQTSILVTYSSLLPMIARKELLGVSSSLLKEKLGRRVMRELNRQIRIGSSGGGDESNHTVIFQAFVWKREELEVSENHKS